ncbi:hypothetical protein O181_102973 [Austropuccinia psidii MF-1]|uniref:Uncharacterized protein n=1 Tax=Austropuccinia psidii MF-1 TaxID=1389203 RepID=A0A9Q3JHB6_9BASI|nr:hypothetical protein [Austropuccinia psidii MF-1]
MTPDLKKEGPVVSKSSQQALEQSKDKHKGPQKKQRGPRKGQLAHNLPTRVQDSQVRALRHGKCVQYGQNSYGVHSQGTGKDEKDLFKQIIYEIRYIQYIMAVKLNKFDTELKKLTSNIKALRDNGRDFTEWFEVINDRLE